MIAAAAAIGLSNALTMMDFSLIAKAEINNDENRDSTIFLTYEKIDSDGDGSFDYIEITDCDEYAPEACIPSEIEGLPVISIGNEAFSGCLYLGKH